MSLTMAQEFPLSMSCGHACVHGKVYGMDVRHPCGDLPRHGLCPAMDAHMRP